MTSTTATPTPTRPTFQLPSAAVAALARLEAAFAGQSVADRLAHEAGSYVRVTPDVQRAVTRYEVAVERRAELLARSARDWSGAEFDSFTAAEKTIAESKATLAKAGQLHLIAGDVR